MKKISFIVVSLLLFRNSFAQTTDNTTLPATEAVKKYPEIKGYVGIVHPLYTFSKDGNQANFRDYYVVGNPWGINIWKSPKFGISFEFTPFIRFENNTSKLSNFVFHPGVCYRLGHDFTFIFRAAYETSGRYGVTPIINKVLVRGKQANFFVALLAPVRFGNNHATAFTPSFQFGVGF